MFDRRYPHMVPIDRPLPGLSPWDADRVRRVGSEVARRTDTRCFYNFVSKRMFFVYGDEPHGGPLSLEVRRYEQHEIDDAVWYISHGKMERRAKDRLAANQKTSEDNDRAERQGRFLDGRRKDTLDYAAHLDRKRRGVAKTAIAV